MLTKEQVETQFRQELQALLDKWGADLEINTKYHSCYTTETILAVLKSDFDNKRHGCSEYMEFDLGQEINHKENSDF